jgi:hypothetical protein
MCTVTWLHEEDGGFHLFCSRDENLTRAAARTPEVFETGGVRWIAPLDPGGGGSWIGVNEFGDAVCLLNGNGAAGRVSRGRLVVEMISSRAEARPELKLAPHNYSPFTLIVLAYGKGAITYTWDGRDLKTSASKTAPPLASSSVAEAEAQRARTDLFETLQPRTVADHLAFHASHRPKRGALSPCMHRADAETVSFTHLHVAPELSTMTYYAAPLCTNPEPITVHLYARCSVDRPIHAGQ